VSYNYGDFACSLGWLLRSLRSSTNVLKRHGVILAVIIHFVTATARACTTTTSTSVVLALLVLAAVVLLSFIGFLGDGRWRWCYLAQ
jgi:hypothetical protein